MGCGSQYGCIHGTYLLGSERVKGKCHYGDQFAQECPSVSVESSVRERAEVWTSMLETWMELASKFHDGGLG